MTGLLWLKLRNDLRATWPRMVLMVVAISVSLVVFSAVLYTRGITAREINRAYLGTNPASATVVLDRDLDAAQMAEIAAEARTRPGIIDATARAQFTTQLQDANGRWQANPLQIFVFAPEDPLRMARLQIEKDSWPPAPGDILIEREALRLLGLKVGDTVVIKSPSGAPARLRVSAVAHDPSLAPAPQEQKGYGFISTASLPGLGEPVALDELKIQVADEPGLTTPSRDRDTIAAAGLELGTWLQQKYGVAVREVQVPDPYEHPHAGQLDALLLAMLISGMAAVLLSAILVATMLNGLFTQQIPQIGIMKAIGARTSRIVWFYLLMTLLVAVIATTLALAPGILISRSLSPEILSGMLGMDATSLVAPLWMYAVVVAIGLTLPPLMALVPLIKTSRTTARAAIDYRGLGGRNSNTRLEAWLGKLRGPNRTMLMALRNSIRRRARFLLAIGLLASAGTLFVSGLSTMASVQGVLERAKDQRHWDVEVSIASTTSTADATSIAQRIPHVTRVEAWTIAGTGVARPGQIGITSTYPDQGHGSLAVAAVPAGQIMQSIPSMIEGRWLLPGETGAIVLNQIARANTMPGVRPGETVQLTVGGRPTTWQVVGIAKEMFVGTGAYVTADGYTRAIGQTPQANVLRIATDKHDEQTRADVANSVERALSDGSVKVTSAASVSRMEEASTEHVLPIITILLAIAVAMGLVGCIGLASTMSANVLERMREFGIMHAIGAGPAVVRRTVIFEGIFIAIASCIAAALPTLALTAVMAGGLGNMFMYAPLPLTIALPAVITWVAVVVVGAALATWIPASRASRLTVRQALSYL